MPPVHHILCRGALTIFGRQISILLGILLGAVLLLVLAQGAWGRSPYSIAVCSEVEPGRRLWVHQRLPRSSSERGWCTSGGAGQ